MLKFAFNAIRRQPSSWIAGMASMTIAAGVWRKRELLRDAFGAISLPRMSQLLWLQQMDRLAFANTHEELQEHIPYSGLSIRSNNDSPGMEVVAVNTDSPAWHAGLKHGDNLIEIEGQPVNKIGDYRQIVYAETVEKKKRTLQFKVLRRGKVKIVDVQFQ